MRRARVLAAARRSLVVGLVAAGGVTAAPEPAGASGSTPHEGARTSGHPCTPVPATTTTTTTTTTSTTTAPPATTAPVGSTSEATTTTAPTTTTSATTTTVPASTPGATGAYDLVSANGAIHNYGGAGTFASKSSPKGAVAISAGAATIDGGGYWLITKKGNIYSHGDAAFFGSPVHVKHLKPIVALTPTPDSGGYWTITSRGNIYSYGDAAFCGSPVHEKLAGQIVAFSSTIDGGGYYAVSSGGTVYAYGDAVSYGDKPGRTKTTRIVSMAVTPDGGGYWLAGANGSIYNFGDAHFYGSAVHKHLPGPIVSMARTPDGGGYWLTTDKGNVYNYGDAHFYGSLAHSPPKKGQGIVALLGTYANVSTSVVPLPPHVIGYDISNFQCKKAGSSAVQSGLPPTSALTVIEVAGWLDSADNSCLSAEATYAVSAAGLGGASYELYLFMNSPSSTATAQATAATGPKGTCASLSSATKPSCLAYNYGFNGAKNALSYANGKGVHSAVWWLDVENDSLSSGTTSNFSAGKYWSGSTGLNDLTLEGAIDALRQAGIVVGIYSTSVQYPKIMGNFVPSGATVPLWIAGVPWTNPPYSESLPNTSVLTTWCAGTAMYSGTKSLDLFADGVPWLLQETPGSVASPYGIDPDYTC